jgi:hypothetical protein
MLMDGPSGRVVGVEPHCLTAAVLGLSNALQVPGKGLHSSTFRNDETTLRGIWYVHWAVSVTKMAQVELRSGRVEAPGVRLPRGGGDGAAGRHGPRHAASGGSSLQGGGVTFVGGCAEWLRLARGHSCPLHAVIRASNAGIGIT